jgi:hypothetical protein
MSAFDDLLGAGFGFLVAVTNAPTLTFKGVIRSGVCTSTASTKDMRETGYYPRFHCVFELLAADFVDLGVKDRSVVYLTDPGQAITNLPLKVIGINTDGADATVKLALKEEPADRSRPVSPGTPALNEDGTPALNEDGTAVLNEA